ncbi:hypothetical protein BDP27DRAFT_1412665 [Rhodocollybia butyracea]|uniref:Uncharacterized protein n=1 Tax=Rhodocollybia butyracea TaxID=206335 RepID=A0A9P5Q5A5_9AGAR|nr:hypothetical protein BDP27DRAFT_1412665 [Rhodocollybia butyracea]
MSNWSNWSKFFNYADYGTIGDPHADTIAPMLKASTSITGIKHHSTISSTTTDFLRASTTTSFTSSYTPTMSSTSGSVTSTSRMPHLGPGLVIPWTASSIPSSSMQTTSTVIFATGPSNTAVSDIPNTHSVASDPNHRTAIVIGCVVFSLLVLSLMTCILLNTKRLRSMLFTRRADRDLDSYFVKDLEQSKSPETAAKGGDSGQVLSSTFPTWIKLPSQISTFHNHRDSLLSYFRPGRDSLASYQSRPRRTTRNHQREKVVDIVSDFPRSRWSVTSSDCSYSLDLGRPCYSSKSTSFDSCRVLHFAVFYHTRVTTFPDGQCSSVWSFPKGGRAELGTKKSQDFGAG